MVEKEKFYCHQAASQAPETRGEITEDFCLNNCRSAQRGVKAECPEVAKCAPKPTNPPNATKKS